MKDKKIYIVLTILLFLSGIIVFAQSSLELTAESLANSRLLNNETTIIKQKVLETVKDPISVKVLYANNEVVATVTDLDKIEKMINDVNKAEYEKEFPESQLGFGDDVFIAEEMSYFVYEDVDSEIKDYIVSEDLLAIETNKITFSNGAVIYVKNLEDFESAKEKYVLNFVNEKELEYIKDGMIPPLSKEYGSTAKSLEVLAPDFCRVEQ